MRLLKVQSAQCILQNAELIFWDFDGVIKDSVEVKSDAFEKLFLPYGRDIALQVRRHHETNCGISRFEKIPLYLGWVGESDSLENVNYFCERFSKAVLEAVLKSPWVPGVHEYLQTHHAKKKMVLVTATPLGEILEILERLHIVHCFQKVYGAPTKKILAIKQFLQSSVPAFMNEQVLMIGDSYGDFEAAKSNGIPFLLRRTNLNTALQGYCNCPMFDNLS